MPVSCEAKRAAVPGQNRIGPNHSFDSGLWLLCINLVSSLRRIFPIPIVVSEQSPNHPFVRSKSELRTVTGESNPQFAAGSDSMATALISHPECFRHEPPDSHPERPARLRAVLSELEHPRFSSLVRVNAEKADLDVLLRVHAPGLVETILESRDAASRGRIQSDADTYMSAGSADAALHAAGAVVEAVDGVMGGKYGNAFCAVRPPGHHAERLRPMGFCLFNNIAVGAMQARDKHGLQRIAVVDFDVHHGNGTQDAFFRD